MAHRIILLYQRPTMLTHRTHGPSRIFDIKPKAWRIFENGTKGRFQRPLVFAAALLGLAATECVARAGPAADGPGLVRDWGTLNAVCRGGRGDDPATRDACTRRDAVDRRLESAGWCYGRPGDAGYQRVWRPCAGTSR
ncbi:hypothetical protein [Methylobacterium aquaticum]|uniref:hypothetical protein n=1 Tax=Methylobacterium aquaticum TaxID=270351 RepID=UPI000AF11AB0|nr:hypothetical protein [Methylobacterium aquaticum]